MSQLYLPFPFECGQRSTQFGPLMEHMEQGDQGQGAGVIAWDADDDTKAQAAAILRRLDILREYESMGFVPLPGYAPDAQGWLPGQFDGRPCAFINVGNTPARGDYKECVGPCSLRGERVH